jgi:hypothetical protein
VVTKVFDRELRTRDDNGSLVLQKEYTDSYETAVPFPQRKSLHVGFSRHKGVLHFLSVLLELLQKGLRMLWADSIEDGLLVESALLESF